MSSHNAAWRASARTVVGGRERSGSMGLEARSGHESPMNRDGTLEREGNQAKNFRALRQLIREDWERHDRRWSMPGFQALAVQRLGAWLHGRKPRRTSLRERAPWLVYRMLFVLVRNLYGIELYHTTLLGRRVRISHQHGISVHQHAEVGDDCHIHQLVTIGRGARGRHVGVPRIGSGVELAPGAVLIGPITVGDGARIGPNAVVMSDVPPGASAAASPARIMKISADSPDVPS